MISDLLIIQLQNSPLFANVQANRIKYILEKYPHQIRKYSKDELVVSKGEQWNELKIIIDGTVSAFMNDDNSKVLKVEDFKVGQCLAPAFLFTKDQHYPVEVLAGKDCQVLNISKEILLQIFTEEQAMLENYLSIVSNIVQTLTKKVRILTLKTLKAKVCFILLQESTLKKSDSIKFARQQMADFLGVERPSLSRVLGQLHQEKLIEIAGKQIIILNKSALKKIIP